MNNIRIGTRASALALIQADKVGRLIEMHNPGVTVELVKIRTKGDTIADVPLHKIGAKGLFIKEIEEALLKGDIDIAVHSLKDLPCVSAPGLAIGAYLARENPCDVLISGRYASLRDLPDGATVGTGSRRRESQLRAVMPRASVCPLRGNVETRMKKAVGGDMDAVIIAAAGVLRLGRAGEIREYLPADAFTPPPGQGIIAAQIRSGDARTASVLMKANDKTAERCYAVEKEFLLETGGGCFLPVGALCEETADGTVLYGYIGDEKGEKVFKETVRFAGFDPARGRALARKLLDSGGREVLLEIRKKENSDNEHRG
jgi:hydroxymethylbilane synthase